MARCFPRSSDGAERAATDRRVWASRHVEAEIMTKVFSPPPGGQTDPIEPDPRIPHGAAGGAKENWRARAELTSANSR